MRHIFLIADANVKTTNKYGDSPLYLFTYAYFFYGCDFGAVDALIEAGKKHFVIL